MTKFEYWRKERGYTYRQLADLLGCTHQYVKKVAVEGTAASIKLAKIIRLSKGELTIEDFLPKEALEEMKEQGFIPKDEEIEEDFLV